MIRNLNLFRSQVWLDDSSIFFKIFYFFLFILFHILKCNKLSWTPKYDCLMFIVILLLSNCSKQLLLKSLTWGSKELYYVLENFLTCTNSIWKSCNLDRCCLKRCFFHFLVRSLLHYAWKIHTENLDFFFYD